MRSSFSFERFQPKFDTLVARCVDALKQPIANIPDPLARGFFVLNVQMSRNAWHTVAFLCGNQRNAEPGWLWDYVLMVPAINRTILDSLFNVLFMLEDVPSRSKWFHQSGWREAKEQLEREKAAYAGLPEWDEYLQNVERIVDAGIERFQITPAQLANIRSVEHWPNPGRMIRHSAQPQTSVREFLQYMNDWYYREHSSQSHLSFHGMMKLGMFAIRRDYGQERQQQIEAEPFEMFRAQQVTRTVTLLLALISEVNKAFALGLDDEVRGLWADLVEGVPESFEIFSKRYAAFWGITL